MLIEELQRIYENRQQQKYLFQYIRYLYRVNPKYWNPMKLSIEYGISYNSVNQITRAIDRKKKD